MKKSLRVLSLSMGKTVGKFPSLRSFLYGFDDEKYEYVARSKDDREIAGKDKDEKSHDGRSVKKVRVQMGRLLAKRLDDEKVEDKLEPASVSRQLFLERDVVTRTWPVRRRRH